jgi:hypothetical protein
MDPPRSPQWVCNAHLSDQPAYFERHRWSTATRSRLPAPVRSESRAVPTDNGFRLHNRQRIANVRKQSIQTNEYQTVDGAEGEFLWSSPPQNVFLLPQRPNLCLKRRSRADQIDDHPTNKPAKIPHGTTASPDSLSTASQTRFATGTTGFFEQCAHFVSAEPNTGPQSPRNGLQRSAAVFEELAIRPCCLPRSNPAIKSPRGKCASSARLQRRLLFFDDWQGRGTFRVQSNPMRPLWRQVGLVIDRLDRADRHAGLAQNTGHRIDVQHSAIAVKA